MNPPAFFAEYQDRNNTALERFLSVSSEPKDLLEAISYMVLDGGKRLRPLLVYASGLMCKANISDLDNIAAAVELIHVYSLIHDDLPAMDNDDLRRGKPSCHKKYNEAMAILCGDAIQSLAFELLSQPFISVSFANQIKLINILAKAIGTRGMVAGQILDLAAEGKKINLPELEKIHHHKTGMLISAAICMGAIAGRISETDYRNLQLFSEYLGIMFQIKDDILDVTGTTEKLGKPQGSDAAREKATYPAILGVVESEKLAQTYFQRCLSTLEAISLDTTTLKEIAVFTIERDH